ncbi:hypothetical protein ABW636_11400 [Aquimarina sp. 2201CG1-2-11]|uniref:hypothetical protein n=1 Tax=Aquimarina discodermiae TaxID=3231043 RepID=UPI0034626002
MFSCAKDEREDNRPPYIEQGVMKIDKVKATSVVVSFSEGNPDNIVFQIRKKGDQEFIAVDNSQVKFFGQKNTILGLAPLEEYELTISVFNEEGYYYGIKSFKTRPFDGGDIRTYYSTFNNVYSEINYEHAMYVNAFPKDIDLKLFLLNKDKDDKKIPLEYSYKNDSIHFTVPTNALSTTAYEFYREYYLYYEIENEISDTILYYDGLNSSLNNEKLLLSVFNPKPYITGIERNYKAPNCENTGIANYELIFEGHFMGVLIGEPNYREFFNMVFTNLDDNTQTIIEPSKEYCSLTVRTASIYSPLFSSSNIRNGQNGVSILIRRPESKIPGRLFTTGRYSVKFNFFNEDPDSFAETNEFEFTLE